jgi:hypothetical protein
MKTWEQCYTSDFQTLYMAPLSLANISLRPSSQLYLFLTSAGINYLRLSLLSRTSEMYAGETDVNAGVERTEIGETYYGAETPVSDFILCHIVLNCP